jgi:hypothetical protein
MNTDRKIFKKFLFVLKKIIAAGWGWEISVYQCKSVVNLRVVVI